MPYLRAMRSLLARKLTNDVVKQAKEEEKTPHRAVRAREALYPMSKSYFRGSASGSLLHSCGIDEESSTERGKRMW